MIIKYYIYFFCRKRL